MAKVQYIIGISGKGTLSSEEMAFFAKYVRDNWGKKLPIEEIENAFLIGAQKKLDVDTTAYNTFSIAYIETILQAYMIHKHKLLVPKTAGELPEKTELSQDEKDAIVWQSCLTAFEEFKVTGDPVEFGSVKYDFLKERGMIPFNKDRRNEMMNLARQRVTIKCEVKITTAKTFSDMQKIKDMIINGGKDFDTLCIEEAKTVAINTLFRELVETGRELTDLIPQ